MKVTCSLVVAIVLVGLPFLGLVSPSYTWQPAVGPYGSFVSQASSLLTLSRCVAFFLVAISLALALRWKSAAIHAAIYVAAALVLMAAGTPLARTTEATSRKNVQAFYDGLQPGQQQGAIERRIMETENFSFSPLNPGEHDRLAGFPMDADAKTAMIVKSHGTPASIALWFRPGPDDGTPTLARKAYFDKETIHAMAPPLADQEDRVMVGVLSSTDRQTVFIPCHTGAAYSLTLERAPEQAQALIGSRTDGDRRNAILIGRFMEAAPGLRVVDIRGWQKMGRSGTHDQSFYDTCHLQIRQAGSQASPVTT